MPVILRIQIQLIYNMSQHKSHTVRKYHKHEEKKEMQQRKIFEFTTLKCQQRNQWHWLAVVDTVSVYKSG